MNGFFNWDIESIKHVILEIANVFVILKILISFIVIVMFYISVSIIISPHDSHYGFIGIDKQKSSRGLGFSMLIMAIILGILQPVVEAITSGIFDVDSPLSTLDYPDSATQGDSVFILSVHMVGQYFSLWGIGLIAYTLISASSATQQQQVSPFSRVLYSFLGGGALILIGQYMATYSN